MQRIGVAMLLYDAYQAGSYSSDTYLASSGSGAGGPDFGAALSYWGGFLVTGSVSSCGTFNMSSAWSSHWPGDSNDYVRARLITALAVAYDWNYPHLSLSDRRAWRKKLADELSSYYTDFASSIPSRTDPYPNHRRRTLLAGHSFAKMSAVGIASSVLYREMDSSSKSSTRNTMATKADDFFQDFLWQVGGDGASSNGIGYDESYLEEYLRYVEALRMDPGRASSISTDFYGDWIAKAPEFMLRQTVPTADRSRVDLNDSGQGDQNGPSYLSARIADELGDSLSQRVAWLGANARSWPGQGMTHTRRDVLDILWWKPSTVSPLSDTIDLRSRHACQADLGTVEFRTSLTDTSAVQLSVHSGKTIGDHDYPDVGAFTLYRNGWLVSAGGTQPVFRTPSASTILVDGFGQHSDGAQALEAVPEADSGVYATDPEANDSRLLAYLDQSGAAAGPSSTSVDIDVATIGTDITQLYRYDASGSTPDDTRGSSQMFTQVESSNRQLDRLQRWLVWISGQAVIVYDPFESTIAQGSSPFDFSWRLTATPYGTGPSADGLYSPTTCAVDSVSSGGTTYYRYTNGTETRFRFAPRQYSGGTYDSGITPAPSYTAPGREQLNSDVYSPIYASGCSNTYMTTGMTTTSALVKPTNADWLDVKVVDPSSSALTAKATVVGVGDITQGHHLERDITTAQDGMFLTLLRPFAASGTPVSANTGFTGISNGKKIEVFQTNDWVMGLFHDPGASGATVSDILGDAVTGDFGIWVHSPVANGSTTYALQMVNGTNMTIDGGQLALDSGSTPVTMGALTPSSLVVKVDGTVVSVSATHTSPNWVQFSTNLRGSLSIAPSGSTVSPRSSCAP